MTTASPFLESLLSARALESPEDRRSVARVALTALGRTLDGGPSDLATADPDQLLSAARLVLDEDLLGSGAEAPAPVLAAALYELTATLPRGGARTELGRRVATLLYQGAAPTFVAIATRMARTGARALAGPGIEARIALSMFLPLDVDAGVDAFALAVATQRELAGTWVVNASTRSLPERRLAARLLLRAAREATRRARGGDREGVAALLEEIELPRRSTPPPPSTRLGRLPSASTMPPPANARTVLTAWEELVTERESAVWRYAAAARGLLSGVVETEREAIRASLAEGAGATAWRRGACALGASLATSDDDAFVDALELARSPLLARDPGIATALVWGLAAAADAEPEACEELLAELARAAPLPIAESLVELRREVRGAGDRVRVPCRNALAASLERGGGDRGLLALARDVRDDLDGVGERRLQEALDAGLAAFEVTGAGAAHARSAAALAAAEELVARLERLGDETPEVRYRDGTPLVREVDAMLLESRVLPALLALGARGGPQESKNVELAATHALDERLAVLLLAREAKEDPEAARHAAHHQRNLRALLHLVDVDATDLAADEPRRDQLRLRWERVALATSGRLAATPDSPLGRAVAATLARALDALVRHGFADAADVWLFVASQPWGATVIGILAEASRNPDVTAILAPGAHFAAQVRPGPAEEGEPLESRDDPAQVIGRVGALARLAVGIHPGVSHGGDHLRRSLGRLARDLEALVESPRAELADSVTRELDALRPLVAGAVQRCSGRGAARGRRVLAAPSASATRESLSQLAEWVRGNERDLPLDVLALVEDALRAAVIRLPATPPPAVGGVGAAFVGAGAAATAAPQPPRPPSAPPPSGRGDPGSAALPPWIPRRRTLGGFYVHGKIGDGAAGSVFAVSRFDEHDDPGAERFALKVPIWDVATSRTLSEAEFLRLFRQEASALMELPEHPNLARFVTFDAGARPKPILVMELVAGENCEDLALRRGLDVTRSLDVLDGVLAGLTAMHAVGVGHLDLKPSNIILRPSGVPVLVDFGLSGRRLRPGCGTVAYGAPEVWLEKIEVPPTATDLYAFACVAFQLLTGRALFEAPSDHAVVATHLTHDGDPKGLASLTGDHLSPLVSLLADCLRRNPERRPTAPDARRRLASLRSALIGMAWPLG